ncbi:MAG: DUF5050 domain-containing protein [Lachnotalea sp.]
MKKNVIIFIVLLSVLSSSSCGTRSGKLTKVQANISKNEANDVESSAYSVTSESETTQPSAPIITSTVVNNSGNYSIQGEKIYYINGNDWKIYNINTDGGDRKLLSDDHAEWIVVGDSRIDYTITGSNIYSMNINGGDKRLLVKLDSDIYKDVTYEISDCLSEYMPQYRFVATGVTGGTDDWASGYVMGLKVYDENGLPLLSADFSQTVYDQVLGNVVVCKIRNIFRHCKSRA